MSRLFRLFCGCWFPPNKTVQPQQQQLVSFANVVCVGDIHGNFESVCRLWEVLEAKLGPETFSNALVVFLGDYCDRGSDTKEVLEWLSNIKKTRPNTRFLAGNHDFAMAGFLGLSPFPEGESLRSTWEHFKPWREEDGLWSNDAAIAEKMHLQGRRWGGSNVFQSSDTFKSYGVELGDREGLRRAIPEHHKDFISELDWVVDEWTAFGRLLCVHAGFENSRTVEQQIHSLRLRDVRKPWIEPLCGRNNVINTPTEFQHNNNNNNNNKQQQPPIIVSGHHGKLDLISTNRLIIDQQGGDSNLPLAAVVLPSREIVRHTDPI